MRKNYVFTSYTFVPKIEKIMLKGRTVMYKYYNPNPEEPDAGDCIIRAISKVTNQDWDTTYLDLAIFGFMVRNMPSLNSVWTEYLRNHGFERFIIPNTCPLCYTVKDFADDHPTGTYVLATGTHAIAVQSGDYFDSWDSGREIPIFYFERKDGK